MHYTAINTEYKVMFKDGKADWVRRKNKIESANQLYYNIKGYEGCFQRGRANNKVTHTKILIHI